jgi:uncharacterized Zn-finger protein
MQINTSGFIPQNNSTGQYSGYRLPSHRSLMDAHNEIVLGQTLGKEYDEWRISYPGRDEFAFNGLFYCNRQECSSSFRRPRDRNAHIREQEKPVICPSCDKRMAYQSDMKKHARTHLKAEERPRIPCPNCTKVFTKHDNMKRHMDRKH